VTKEDDVQEVGIGRMLEKKPETTFQKVVSSFLVSFKAFIVDLNVIVVICIVVVVIVIFAVVVVVVVVYRVPYMETLRKMESRNSL
jgi:ABC-type siderophore export system fused ATPase/permease subunit